MFSDLFKFAGQVIGETVHQTGKLVEDIANIPEAIAKGYEEELFEKKPPEQTTTQTPTQEEPTKES